MADTTKIQYTDYTFNPWVGCSKVHVGCKNCYAETFGKRFGVQWGPNGTRRKTSAANWRKPLAWNRKAEAAGVRGRVMFTLGDPFEDWGGPIVDAGRERLTRTQATGHKPLGPEESLPPDWEWATMDDLRHDLFDLIDRTPNLDWLLFTKRPENIQGMWPNVTLPTIATDGTSKPGTYFRPNVHLIYSASDQETLEAGLPHLLKCRDLAPVLGLSLEPLLGPISLNGFGTDVNPVTGQTAPTGAYHPWVAVGGESGRDARLCNIAWIRSVVEQCKAADVPCYVKQIGSCPYDPRGDLASGESRQAASKGYITRNGTARLLRDPKGGDPSEWPEDVRVRELPRD